MTTDCGPGPAALPSRAERRRVRAGTPLSRRLLALVAAVVLPLAALCVGSLWAQYRTERTRAEAALMRQAEGLAGLVDREFERTEVAARVLASSAALMRGELNAFGGEMRAAAALLSAEQPPGAAPVWMRLLGADGRRLFDTAPGDERPEPAPLPPHVQEALRTGQSRVSDLFLAKRNGIPTVSVAVPVLSALDGRAVGLIGATVPRGRLAAALASSMPTGRSVTLQDRKGMVVAHVPEAQAAIGAPAAPALPPDASGLLMSDLAPGGAATLAFARAPFSGFVVRLAVPEKALLAPLRAAMLRAAGLAALVFAAGLTLAVMMARRTVAALRRVPVLALQADGGALPPTGLREADELAASLAGTLAEQRRADAALAASEARLRVLNEGLEERVRREVAAREAAQARLVHAQRMEALGQLAGGIAHDFNNVLQAVQGGAALIERRAGDAAGVRRLARMVCEAAERGASVTRRLLAFSRRNDLRAEALDPAALLADLREILTHTLGVGIGIRVEATGLPALLADKGQLETVLINLATNARDAMDGHGTLVLAATAERIGTEDAPAHAAGLDAGSYVRLSVSDTGPGMAPDVLARVTEPFFTTKAPGKGTGLGLAMAKGFAGQSGGGLLIESAPGQGTSISLWLPQAEDPVAAPGLPAPAQAARARVLLVDDDDAVRELTREGLADAGWDVVAAESGAAALALLQSGEVVDLLVSDLSMPDMDGLAVIRAAQRHRPGLPAILLTGFASNAAELAVGGAVSGRFSLLRKPVTVPHLSERMAVMLGGRTLPEAAAG